MKDKLFYSTNSGQVVRRLGFGFDFTRPYYEVSVESKRARLGFSISRLTAVVAIRNKISKIFEAFRIVISSPIV